MTTVYAESMNYWKTSQSGADAWIAKAKGEITKIGGHIEGEAFLAQGDKQAFALAFTIGVDAYRVEWPVLPLTPKERDPRRLEDDQRAAKVQAATMLYYDIKHKAVMQKVFGKRAAFVQYLVLPSGTTVGAASDADIQHLLPSVSGLLPTPKGSE